MPLTRCRKPNGIWPARAARRHLGPLRQPKQLGQPDHPEAPEAISAVIAATLRHDKAVGAFAVSPEDAFWHCGQGVSFVALYSDVARR